MTLLILRDNSAGYRVATQAPESPRWRDADDMRWAVRRWAARMGVATPRMTLRYMTGKWASISTGGRLTLNTDLLDLPRELGEFVIVHELAHLLAPNHGPVFKSFMAAYLPDWEERSRRLRLTEMPIHRT